MVRFGLTVGKHNARLSVERALVKRLLRESSRLKRQTILNFLENKDYGLNVSLCLKGRLPVCKPDGLSKQARKVLLRDDIEKLFPNNYKAKVRFAATLQKICDGKCAEIRDFGRRRLYRSGIGGKSAGTRHGCNHCSAPQAADESLRSRHGGFHPYGDAQARHFPRARSNADCKTEN